MNIAIIDDLAKDRKKLQTYLKTYYNINCIHVQTKLDMFERGEDFLSKFVRNHYDFIFIDYYMDKLSGMDVAKEIRKTDQEAIIIFTTVSQNFAIDGYKVKAAGYLVKPISYEDFSDILGLIDSEQIRSRQFIELKNGQEKTKILLKDIIYCDIFGHYTQVHTISMGIRRFRMPFQNIVHRLAEYPEFLFCYRGCIINLELVEKVDDLSFLMTNGERLPFRKKEHDKMMRLYSDFVFGKARKRKL